MLKKSGLPRQRSRLLKRFPLFMDHVMNDYVHSYGTVCHAVAACGIAAAYAANKMDGARGGLTGFQASFVMWDFIRQWQYSYNKCGLRIVDYDNMLYPQYEDKFQKTITKDVWESLQREAKKSLENSDYAAERVVRHWQSIVNGKVPFGYRVVDKR